MWTAVHLSSPAGSWHYFDTGARLLLATSNPLGGLHLYHSNPELQIGPVTFLVALPFTLLSAGSAKLIAAVVMSVIGLGLLALASTLLPAESRSRILWPGVLFIPVWEELAGRAGHLDDVLALTLTVGALVAIQRKHGIAGAVLLALAADAKPWALAFVPLLLVVPATQRLRALSSWSVTVALAWLPFLFADPRSVIAASYRIQNAAGSALRVLGVTDPSTPLWCRPAQLILGVGLAWLLWRRGRVAAIVLAVIAVRLLLDPATWSYYTAGLLLGTVLLDLCRTRQRRAVPWFTLGGFVCVFLPSYVHLGPLAAAPVQGILRAGFLLAALAGAYTVTSDIRLTMPAALGARPSQVLLR
ncbi:MAG: hypothetical protein JWO57_1367 [Pseudonocardiales bacterium]|nr:hypothetical protein [Pseudonocardiales bacterium]